MWLDVAGMAITLLGVNLTTSEIYSERKLIVDNAFGDKWLEACHQFKPVPNYRKKLNEVYKKYPTGTIGDLCTQTTEAIEITP